MGHLLFSNLKGWDKTLSCRIFDKVDESEIPKVTGATRNQTNWDILGDKEKIFCVTETKGHH